MKFRTISIYSPPGYQTTSKYWNNSQFIIMNELSLNSMPCFNTITIVYFCFSHTRLICLFLMMFTQCVLFRSGFFLLRFVLSDHFAISHVCFKSNRKSTVSSEFHRRFADFLEFSHFFLSLSVYYNLNYPVTSSHIEIDRLPLSYK